MLKSNYSGFSLEAGTDEAGRGCLCGPVVAAAVILPKGFTHPFLNDSKQLSEKRREELRPFIEENAIAFAVSFVWQEEVDKINVLQASITGMHRSIDALKIVPEFIIVDGNKFRVYNEIPYETIVKGDAKSFSIAAASVLAKVTRDRIMDDYHHLYPQYEFSQHKGYGTKLHRELIVKYGPCPIHRRTFKRVKEYLNR